MKPKFGVVVFPGSNCDHDTYYVIKKIFNCEVNFLWHKESDLQASDVIILPGGFSYGDYLRSGSIARFSPIMNSVIDFANKGGIVLGICTDNYNSVFTNSIEKNDVLKIPVAHGEGNYFADEKTIEQLKNNDQILFRYSTAEGKINEQVNPNGSILNIAGITNEKGNILGMMPHPERCCDPLLGKTDGKEIFNSIINTFNNL